MFHTVFVGQNTICVFLKNPLDIILYHYLIGTVGLSPPGKEEHCGILRKHLLASSLEHFSGMLGVYPKHRLAVWVATLHSF